MNIDFLVEYLAMTKLYTRLLLGTAQWMLMAVPLVVLSIGLTSTAKKLPIVLLGFGTSIVFQVAFSLAKSSIPYLVPFYADPWLAEFDRWLHGGHDPWIFFHRWFDWMPADWIVLVYYGIWAIPAFVFVVALALFDHDEQRQRRYVILYVFCWLGLGNFLALAVSSVGPIFYDDLYDQGRFSELHQALEKSGLLETKVGLLQSILWENFARNDLSLGSGISAFPSIHVASATLVSLYAIERIKAAALPAIAFVVLIEILSVYIGFHYAIDGYVAIAAMLAAWAVLSPQQRRSLWPLPKFGHKYQR